jgi:hypothetical protein
MYVPIRSVIHYWLSLLFSCIFGASFLFFLPWLNPLFFSILLAYVHQSRSFTFNLRRALNLRKQSTVSCRWIVPATRSRCYNRQITSKCFNNVIFKRKLQEVFHLSISRQTLLEASHTLSRTLAFFSYWLLVLIRPKKKKKANKRRHDGNEEALSLGKKYTKDAYFCQLVSVINNFASSMSSPFIFLLLLLLLLLLFLPCCLSVCPFVSHSHFTSLFSLPFALVLSRSFEQTKRD